MFARKIAKRETPWATDGIPKDIMRTSPTDEVLADFRVPPIDVDRLDAHGFGTHHLLRGGELGRELADGMREVRGVRDGGGSLRAACAAFLPSDP